MKKIPILILALTSLAACNSADERTDFCKNADKVPREAHLERLGQPGPYLDQWIEECSGIYK